MALILKRSTFEEFTGNTPDYEGNPDYFIINEDTVAGYLALVNAEIPRNHWTIVDEQLVEMSQEEIDAVEADALAAAKSARQKDLAAAITAFINSKYTRDHKDQMLYMMLIAAEKEPKMPNRFDYLNQVGVWAGQCLAYYYQQEAAVQACETAEDVAAVEFDTSALEDSDPHVLIRNALAITD